MYFIIICFDNHHYCVTFILFLHVYLWLFIVVYHILSLLCGWVGSIFCILRCSLVWLVLLSIIIYYHFHFNWSYSFSYILCSNFTQDGMSLYYECVVCGLQIISLMVCIVMICATLCLQFCIFSVICLCSYLQRMALRLSFIDSPPIIIILRYFLMLIIVFSLISV